MAHSRRWWPDLPSASAGTTATAARSSPRMRSYPRERGDDSARTCAVGVHWELPPRAWGRHRGATDARVQRGATPASAGTTTCATTRSRRSRSYPRERGDDTTYGRGARHSYELPPRARGRRHGRVRLLVVDGATPASAGTTTPGRTCLSRGRSYPRERGDDVVRPVSEVMSEELPPRARGRQHLAPDPDVLGGAIPASAGTTERR